MTAHEVEGRLRDLRGWSSPGYQQWWKAVNLTLDTGRCRALYIQSELDLGAWAGLINTLASLSSYSHISCPCLLLAKFKGKPEKKQAWVVQFREAMLLGHIAGQRMVLGLWVYVGGD